MRIRSTLLAAAGISLGLAATAHAGDKDKAAKGKDKKTLVMVPAADLKWTPINPKAEGGPQWSIVWGDPMKGAGGFFLKSSPGSEAPVHAHSQDYYAVVVKGQPAHGLTKASAKVLQPGSQWYQPADEMHYDGCTGTTDCVILVNMTGKFDFIPQPPPKEPAHKGK